MRQLVHTMFIANNHVSFHLWWKENLVKQPKFSKYYVHGCRCGNLRCEVCTSIQVTGTFSSLVTKSAYKINHNFSCNSKCLIYLLSCKTCDKQYTGKTVDKFSSRWNNYKLDARKAASGNIESCKQLFLQN